MTIARSANKNFSQLVCQSIFVATGGANSRWGGLGMWNFSAPQIMVQALIDMNYSRLNSFIHHLLITHSFFDYNLSIYRHVLCFSLDQNIKGKLKIFLVYIFSIPKQEENVFFKD